MIDGLEFAFDRSPLEGFFDQLNPEKTVSAAYLLTMLDGESEETVMEVLDRLDAQQVQLDLAPMVCADSATVVRLRREAELVKKGNLLDTLEENDPLRLYLQELAMLPVCGDLPAYEASLLQANAAGDAENGVYTQVFHLCISRVVELAMDYTGKGVLLEDLIQEASMGLWMALTGYTGGSLEAFRDAVIEKYLVQTVILQAHTAGVGQKLRQDMEDYRSVDEQLLTELGRNPTLEEIAQAMHKEPETVAAVADMVAKARDMHRMKNPEDNQPIEEEADQAVEDTAYFQMRQRIAELLSGLEEQDAKLLTLRYGLEGNAPMTPEQVGAKLGLTPEEVVACEAVALAKLRAK